jgi:hypothetical protein
MARRQSSLALRLPRAYAGRAAGRSFLGSLDRDATGHPLYEGRPAGVGGVYRVLPS